MSPMAGTTFDNKHGVLGFYKTLSSNLTIRRKLTLIIMLACITCLLIAAVTFVAYEWVVLRRFMDWSLSSQTGIVADTCKAAVAFNDSEDAKETLSSLRVHSSIVFGGIYDESGKLMAAYYRQGEDKNVQPKVILQKGSEFAGGYLTVYDKIILDGEVIGTVCIRSDLSPLYAMLADSVKIVLAIMLISIAVAYLLSSRLQSVVSVPILNLAGLAKNVSEQRDY
ncbi:MAG: CHASE sensor domain-containing protein, partial [Phycisphaerae bacterium]